MQKLASTLKVKVKNTEYVVFRAEPQAKSNIARQNHLLFVMTSNTCLRVSAGVFRPWKFEHMATDLLCLQLREDHPLPPDAVLYFTQSLIHDSISIRKVCRCPCFPPDYKEINFFCGSTCAALS